MNGSHTADTYRRGITLLETLATLFIITILLGLIIPALVGARRAARRKEAAVRVRLLANGIAAYRGTYGKWPAQVQADHDTTHLDCNAVLADLTNNPRRIAFLSAPDGTQPGSAGTDPWQRALVVAMDEDGDGSVSVAAGPLTTNVANESVAVLSWGPAPDDTNGWVYSWKQ
jgi:type II secretory pathway pseudopilin PulG